MERLKKDSKTFTPGSYEAKVREIKLKHGTKDLGEITEHNSVSEKQSYQQRSNSNDSRKLKASIISKDSHRSYTKK